MAGSEASPSTVLQAATAFERPWPMSKTCGLQVLLRLLLGSSSIETPIWSLAPKELWEATLLGRMATRLRSAPFGAMVKVQPTEQRPCNGPTTSRPQPGDAALPRRQRSSVLLGPRTLWPFRNLPSPGQAPPPLLLPWRTWPPLATTDPSSLPTSRWTRPSFFVRVTMAGSLTITCYVLQ